MTKLKLPGFNMSKRSRSVLRLQPLESRLAPAMTVVNAATATYTDVDGDLVTVKVSVGAFALGNFTTVAGGVGEQLQTIDFSAGGFANANLTLSVVKAPSGDGLANVGYINSTGHDLGKVTVKGDLGQIDAGDAVTATAGLKTLSVRSMGRFGIDTQLGGNLRSDIKGALGALLVAGDVKETFVLVIGGDDGRIGAITIGGSLIGGSNQDSGAFISQGDMGAVKIGHDVQGGSGGSSASIQCHGNLASVSIGGSLIGGSLDDSGAILSDGDMGVVKIVHNVQGGSGSGSGSIQCGGKLASVSIGGSLIGGANTGSGQIGSEGDMGLVKIGHDLLGGSGSGAGFIRSSAKLAGVSIGGSLIGSGPNSNSGGILSTGDMGAVRIGHDLRGGSGFDSGTIESRGKLAGVCIGGSLIGSAANVGGTGGSGGEIRSAGDMGAVKIGHDFSGISISGSESVDRSGVIQSSGRIASVTIEGSIISGTDTSSGALNKNASIRAGNDIGSFTVKGSLIGNSNPNGDSPVIISARGREFPVLGSDLAIGKVTIGGRVENARILAGYDVNLTPKNADAQIGTITVGGDWAGSSIVAGVVDGVDNLFGTPDDAKISGAGTTDSANIVSRIASITIKGQVLGTPNSVSATDHFGIVAQRIGTLKVGGRSFALTAGLDDFAVGLTGDLRVHEVAL